jgi:hypothetical protein
MPAVLAYHDKQIPSDGAIVEMKIGQLTAQVPGCAHRLKYTLSYGLGGTRLVGYDNERGKGDHRHIGGLQEPYTFQSVEKLVADFLADVRGLRGDT